MRPALPTSPRPSRLLLLTPDGVRAADFRAAALDLGLCLQVEESLAAMGSIGGLGSFSVGIFDADLSGLSGREIYQYVRVFFPWLPCILMGDAGGWEEGHRPHASFDSAPPPLAVLKVARRLSLRAKGRPRARVHRSGAETLRAAYLA